MRMIAIGTIHGRKLIKERDPTDPKSKAKYEDIIAAPNTEFDTKDFGIDEAEAKTLIAGKAAKRKTREVADDGDTSRRKPEHADGLDAKSDAELQEIATARKVVIKPGIPRDDVLAALRKAPAV